MYNVEQLRMFVEAVELGSFSASAKKLGKVQSAVSQGIANLEIDFNIQLFDRKTRKPTLTKQGRQLYKQAKVIVLQMEDLSFSVKSISSNEEDIIKLALDGALLMPSLFPILTRFSEQFPATEIELISVSSSDVAAFIINQRADIGLMFSDLSPNKDIEPCFIGNLPFNSVCHPDHVLAQSDQVKEIDLATHRQLMCRGYDRDTIQQFIEIAGKVWWSNSFTTIQKVLLNSNIGWAYLPSHAVKNDILNNKLAEVNISFDHKAWSPPVDIVTSKLAKKGPALSWLVDNLKVLLD